MASLSGISKDSVYVWDALGAGASVACLIHCLGLPFLVAFAPVAGWVVPGDEVLHRITAFFLVLIGAIAFHAGFKAHRKPQLLWLAGSGLGLLLFAAFAEGLLPSAIWGRVLTVAGGIILISAHVLNSTFCRLCRRCRGQDRCRLGRSS